MDAVSVAEISAMLALESGQIPASDLYKDVLTDRDRLLEEIYELRRFKALAIDLIECMSRSETGA